MPSARQGSWAWSPGHRLNQAAPTSPYTARLSGRGRACVNQPTLKRRPRRSIIRVMTDSRDRLFLLSLVAHAPATFLIGMLMSADQGWFHVLGESVAPTIAA